MGSSALTHPLHFITLGTKGEQVHPKGKNHVQSHTEKVFLFFSLRCLPETSLASTKVPIKRKKLFATKN